VNKLKKWFWQLEEYFYEWKTRYFIKPERVNAVKSGLNSSLVVSLTSYPPRYPKLELTLKCLLSQSIKPDELILWVAKNDYEALPSSVLQLENTFSYFNIRSCDDLGSYKKIIPTLQLWPDSFIVTADDDVYYPKNWLSGLVEAARLAPDRVSGYRLHEITFNLDGNISPYRLWRHNVAANTQSEHLFATGCGGIIYPPNTLHSDVADIKTILSICQNADDVWLYWMLQRGGASVGSVGKQLNVVSWRGSAQTSLTQENYLNNRNDIIIKSLVNHFGNVVPLPHSGSVESAHSARLINFKNTD